MGLLERAKELYFQHDKELIHKLFPQYEGRIAVGFAGHGSECFGFDDEVSQDHDYLPGYNLWLSDEDYESFGFELENAYKSVMSGRLGAKGNAPQIRGVMRISSFYLQYTGSSGAPESWRQWLSLPSHALAEATNGEIWRDDSGEFSAIREAILHGMPEDVWKKRLAKNTVLMAQSGQYNYTRCLKHGERGAAMLALGEFALNACDTVYLLNRAHMPYYKWALRGMEKLERLSDLKTALEFLLTEDNGEAGEKLKAQLIEDVSAQVIKELQGQGLSDGSWDYLEPHAYEIMERIKEPDIRALHIME